MKKLTLLILLTAILSGCAGSRSLRSFLRKHKHPFKRPPKCQTYQALKSQLGDELIMEPAILDSLLIIYIPDTKVYKKLIRHRRDGMQLDMVSRSLFQCGHDYDRPAPEQMGTLLPVKYKRKLRKHTLQDFLHRNYILYGQIPEGAHPDSTEFNIILYQRNKICEYKPFSNVDYSHWELLPTGLYKHQLNAEDSLALESKTLFNHLFFTIPFAHDQSSFQPEDIKPLYDSLSLTDFEIQEIIINAYTSVEGSRYHNHQLAERRAESIVHALQSFQNPRILSHVYVHENFEAFRTDIKGTPLSYLAYLPDDEIPSHLVNETLASIDTLLAKHRKAEIDLILHKKLDLRTVTPAEILDFFDQSIDRKNLKEAIMLQNFIFNQIDHQLLPDSLLGKLDIPQETEYAPAIANLNAYEYAMGNASLENAIEAYEQLRKFAPKSREILYNLTSLQLEGLAAGMNLSPSVIQKHINTLRAMKLDKSLLTRLTINYKIVMTEWYQLHNEYGKKASTLRSIQNDYGKTAFTDDELLRIAKYLSNYRQFTAAIKLLRKRALTSDAPFELQHYYLLLTIGNSEMYQDEHYTDFIDLFQQKYPESICQLFAPKTKGGYSFQLLEHAFWRNRYCEICH